MGLVARLKHGKVVKSGRFNPVREDYADLVENFSIARVSVVTTYHDMIISDKIFEAEKSTSGPDTLKFIRKELSKRHVDFDEAPFQFTHRSKKNSDFLYLSAKRGFAETYEVEVKGYN